MTFTSIDPESNNNNIYEYSYKYKTKSQFLREFFAEFFGTFIMNLMVTGSAASFALKEPISVTDLFGSAFGSGIGVLLGVFVSISTSGGHLNPIVTIALAIVRKFDTKKIVCYLLAQYLGSFCATALVFVNYYNVINNFDRGVRSGFGAKMSTGQIFTTFPNPNATNFSVFLDQIICSSILMIAVLAVMDEKCHKMPKYMIPLLMSLVVCGIIIAFGLNCGAALNPARDLSGRLFLALVGYGREVFTPQNGLYWLIGGIIGPHFGAVIGSMLYLMLIEIQFKTNEDIGLIQ